MKSSDFDALDFKRRCLQHVGAAMLVAVALAATGCASYSGAGLKPGMARLDDVTRTMGDPAMRWNDPDGSVQLAYPRGPLGMVTFMVFIAPDGTLIRIENVLDETHFAAVVRGQANRETILRMFGPPREKLDFDRSNTQTWEWRFRDEWHYASRFVVVFDRSTWIVKDTLQLREPGSGKMGLL